ncbi:spliceosome-associated protein 49 isoform X1 [Iris pallida]|uniref:Spliceosome-associated protein 49 isoform X1 n=1 Tax=Iris pallida TaxID=29817 RepID=A0AAX6I746_IRIPA|nr:spliceosome-associated protein 49 isoform X1 [Iris pallida]KAJ6848255.1 spliceosome-associated protein 49 isoform X1 [Iris pallida]
MARNQAASVYIGNLDEKVSERVLYEILVQVGRIVHLHIPRDRETNRQKNFAFAEYESEEIANYAVSVFSGLVRLHNKTLKFAISGKDKPSQNSATPVTPQPNHLPLLNGSNPHPMHGRDAELSRISAQSLVDCRVSPGTFSPAYPQASHERFVKNGLNNNNNFEYNSRVFGAMMKNVSRPARQPVVYPSY